MNILNNSYMNNPKIEEQFRIYELYNFATGNDDILSDIGNSDEVRYAMWGLMPNNVNNDNYNINEEFISFILNRDKYPDKEIPNIKYLAKKYDECIGNLKETLNHVDDRKRFYNNLLELQDYLIRRKIFSQNSLIKEKLYLDEELVGRMSSMVDLGKEYGVKTAQILASKLKLPQPQYLGGDEYGFAFLIGNRVLKLTNDICEVDAGIKIMTAKPKTLCKVYDVFKLQDSENNVEIYALIEEYIANKPREIFIKYENILHTLGGNEKDFINLSKQLIKAKDDIAINQIREFYKFVLTDNPESGVNKVDREMTYNFVNGLLNIKSELNRLQIKSKDYTNRDNLGYVNNILTYFDIGNCRAEMPSMPSNKVINIPESYKGINNINEDGSSKYSTTDSIGRDDFPIYNQNDTSMPIDNNIPVNINEKYYSGKAYRVPTGYKNLQTATAGDVIRYEQNELGNQFNISDEKISKLDNYPASDIIWVTKKYSDAKRYGSDVQTFNINGEIIAEDGDGGYLILIDKSINERIKTYMPDSKGVEVKKKCRLAGLGNTSAACNQGDVNNLNLKPINEVGEATVQPYPFRLKGKTDKAVEYTFTTRERDMYWCMFKKYVDTVSGDISSINVNKNVNSWRMDFGVYQIGDKGELIRNASVVMNKDKLFKVMATINLIFNDFIKNFKPDEIVFKPKTETDIAQWQKEKRKDWKGFGAEGDVRRKNLYIAFLRRNLSADYEIIDNGEWIRVKRKNIDKSKGLKGFLKKTIGSIMEEEFPAFEKQIEKDIKTHGLDKALIRTLDDNGDDLKIMVVNGDNVRDNGFVGWTDVGHYHVDVKNPIESQKYAKFIPEDEIWVDDILLSKPNDMEAIILHERIERYLMKYHDYDYDKAHDIANKIEAVFRKLVPSGSGSIVANKIYDIFVNKYFNKKKVPSDVVNENKQQMEKAYVKTGMFDDEDVRTILNITGGDGYTKLIADMYYFFGDRYQENGKWKIKVKKLNQNELNAITEAYNDLKNYDKNLFPLHDLFAQGEYAHPLEVINDLRTRRAIINRIRSFPSFLLRNLRNDIRKERNHWEFENLFNTIKEIKKSLSLLERVKPDKREIIYKKIFSSNNDTFDLIKKRLEDTTLPYLSQDDDMDEMISKVDYFSDEAEILNDDNYNETGILIVRIKSSDAMKGLGCSSQWCFATEFQDSYWFQYTEDKRYPVIVYNFNEEPSEPKRMVVVLSGGEVYDMYNEQLENGFGYLDEIDATKYIFHNEPVEMDENIQNNLKKKLNCGNISLTFDVINYLKGFDSDENLLRSGGIPTNLLDTAAFGFNEENLKRISPNRLSIKWKDDYENVKYEIEKSELSNIEWAKKINLSEPIDVSFDGKKFYIEDGHHRYYAAKILNKPLNINLEIKANPILKIGNGLNYDDFHRCAWKQVHNQLNENIAQINSLKSQLAQAAQNVYNEWEQNEEGYCDWLGTGGICQDIADALCNVLSDNNIECMAFSQQTGEQHVFVIAKTNDGVYSVDIPPYLYEEGGGYCWKKIPDVEFDERYVVIDRLSADPNDYENEYMMDETKIVNEAQLMSLQDLPFKKKVEKLGGNIFSVGGAVRDEFLGRESKDLDILITNIPMNVLEKILSEYGRVDAVGKSFGILKFKPKGATEEIDIAIPRTEKATGAGGHKGFEVTSSHDIPIETDLSRRDFTVNAIAKDVNGNIIDPFNGREDLKNKIIRVVNPEAFSDDPLRMLRAIQFASRFGFTIEPKTMKMIQDNASRIKEIPPERILTEFDKIVKKGQKLIGAELLIKTGLFKEIFGRNIGINKAEPWNSVKTMGEFIYMLTKDIMNSPSEFFKNNLKGDINTSKEIRAYEIAFNGDDISLPRAIAHNMFVASPISLQSDILPNSLKIAAQELLTGKYPKSINELAVNGNDLTALGLKGKEIGDTLKMMLLKVYSDKADNDKNDLLKLITNEKR